MDLDESLAAARAAKPAARAAFGEIAQVAGIGIVRFGDRYGLKVNIAQPIDAGITVPEEIEGVPVRVEVVGEIRPR